jgi:hypothetical protein
MIAVHAGFAGFDKPETSFMGFPDRERIQPARIRWTVAVSTVTMHSCLSQVFP